MVGKKGAMPQFNYCRFWTAVASFVISGWLVPPARAGHGQLRRIAANFMGRRGI